MPSLVLFQRFDENKSGDGQKGPFLSFFYGMDRFFSRLKARKKIGPFFLWSNYDMTWKGVSESDANMT